MSLSYTKCNNCRHDRKKCLPPPHSEWPPRCLRCVNKSLPCSEYTTSKPGRIPKRKSVGTTRVEGQNDVPRKRNFRAETAIFHEDVATHIQPIPTPGASSKEQPSHPDPDTRFPEWAFLLSWYSMLRYALEELRRLKEDIYQHFNWKADEITELPAEYLQFETFVEEFKKNLLTHVCKHLTTHGSETDAELAARLLSTWEGGYPPIEPACLQCTGDEHSFLTAYVKSGDTVSELRLRVALLAGHFRFYCREHGGTLELGGTPGSGMEAALIEADRIRSLSKIITGRITTIFKQGWEGLSLPNVIKSSAVILPPQCAQWERLFLFDKDVDAIGRTRLQRNYDIEPPSTELFDRNVLIDAAKSQVCNGGKDLLGRTLLHMLHRHRIFLYEGVGASFLGELTQHLNSQDLNRQTIFGHTALHYAAATASPSVKHSLLSITDALLQAALNPDIKDGSGTTALVYALRRKDIGHVHPFLKSSRNPNFMKWDSKTTLLHWAIQMDSLDTVKLLDQPAFTGWNEANHAELTPLAHAVTRGSLPIVEYLLGREDVSLGGSDVIGIGREYRWRIPLHIAIMGKKTDIVKLLVKHPRIDIHLEENIGASALSFAIFTDNEEVLRHVMGHPDLQEAELANALVKARKGEWKNSVRALELELQRRNDDVRELVEAADNHEASSMSQCHSGQWVLSCTRPGMAPAQEIQQSYQAAMEFLRNRD